MDIKFGYNSLNSLVAVSIVLSQMIFAPKALCADSDSLFQRYDEAGTMALNRGDYDQAEYQYLLAFKQCLNLPTTDYRGFLVLISLAAERLARNDKNVAANIELMTLSKTDAAQPILRPTLRLLRKQEVQAKLDFQRAKQLNYVLESDRL